MVQPCQSSGMIQNVIYFDYDSAAGVDNSRSLALK